MRKSKLSKPPKLNVIPVLDAVFIFVFFLLMSAQFVDLYELHVKKPLLEEVTSSEASDGKSKSFKVKVYDSKIVITQGMDENVVDTYDWSESSMKQLGERLLALKVQNPKENSIVIRPKSDVKYKKIVQVIDLAQKHYTTQRVNGKLFPSVAFEPMD